MERELGFKVIQAQIGYNFKNKDLLNQALTRRSYTEENGGENNEILEFIGDKALDFAVVQLLISKFGKMQNGDVIDVSKQDPHRKQIRQINESRLSDCTNEFMCAKSEGDLTKLKSRMVEKKTLAHRIDELGFAELLRMGNSDIKNGVSHEMSVKEDLFEAIVGAVAIDCGWNFSVIQSVVEAMLIPEDFLNEDIDDNYVRLIYDWEMNLNDVRPWFRFTEQPYDYIHFIPFSGITQTLPFNQNCYRLNFTCELKLLDHLPIFRAFGSSKSEARMNVCKLAYEHLEKDGYFQRRTMRDEINEPSKKEAINQLEILARRNYFSIPTYSFEESHDENGNPIWVCRCEIKEYSKSYTSKSSSKKDAKKLSALKMLKYVIAEDKNV